MYTRADVKIPQQSASKSHPSPQTTTTTKTSSTRRDATNPPLNPIPAPQKPSKRQHTSSKNKGTNTLMGQYQNHIRDLTHKPNPYRIKKSRKPQSQKPSAAEKNHRISRGAKGEGKTYLEGMTRARERGRSGRFGGEGDREVGTSSPAVSCWEDELGVVIFGEER